MADLNVGLDNQGTGNVGIVGGVQPTGGGQQLFTQEQVNAIVSGRVNAEKLKIDELTKSLAKVEQDKLSFQAELDTFKQTSLLTEAGIPKDMHDYVKFEASKLVTDKVPFESAVSEYLKKPEAANLLRYTMQATGTGDTSTAGTDTSSTQQATGQAQTLQGANGTVPATNGVDLNSLKSLVDSLVSGTVTPQTVPTGAVGTTNPLNVSGVQTNVSSNTSALEAEFNAVFEQRYNKK